MDILWRSLVQNAAMLSTGICSFQCIALLCMVFCCYYLKAQSPRTTFCQWLLLQHCQSLRSKFWWQSPFLWQHSCHNKSWKLKLDKNEERSETWMMVQQQICEVLERPDHWSNYVLGFSNRLKSKKRVRCHLTLIMLCFYCHWLGNYDGKGGMWASVLLTPP